LILVKTAVGLLYDYIFIDKLLNALARQIEVSRQMSCEDRSINSWLLRPALW